MDFFGQCKTELHIATQNLSACFREYHILQCCVGVKQWCIRLYYDIMCNMLQHRAIRQVKATEMMLINQGNNNNSQLSNTGQLLMCYRNLKVTITAKVKGPTGDMLLLLPLLKNTTIFYNFTINMLDTGAM